MAGEIADIGEAAGNVATGALAARAVDGSMGERADGHTNETACLNCGTPLAGPHCHQCGQRAHVHRTLSAFFHDLLHGVLHFEGKTWRTLPLLVWKPGQLTREYIEGKRARYVSPIALFLFVVFFTYALFSVLGGSSSAVPDAVGLEEANAVYTQNASKLEELAEARSAASGNQEEVARIDSEIADLRDEQETLGGVLGAIQRDFAEGFREGTDGNPLPEDDPLSQTIEKTLANPQLAIYKAQTNAYKFSWMLIPLSVPFVWLLFPFSRRFRGYDHTVFATYSITFMIALAGLASLLIFVGYGGLGLLALLYAPVHMYRQLRGAYGVSRFGGFWRMLALSLFAWVAIGLFVAVISAMSAGP